MKRDKVILRYVDKEGKTWDSRLSPAGAKKGKTLLEGFGHAPTILDSTYPEWYPVPKVK
jgi:hypothetical protein